MTKRRKDQQKPAAKKAKPVEKARVTRETVPAKSVAASVSEVARREPVSRQATPRAEARPSKATFVLPKASPSPKVPAHRPKSPAAAATPEAVPVRIASTSPVMPTMLVSETWSRSLNAAGQGAVAFNCTLIEMARANLSSSLEIAKSLTEMWSPLHAARFQLAFWDGQFKAFANRAEAIQAASAALITGKPRTPARSKGGPKAA